MNRAAGFRKRAKENAERSLVRFLCARNLDELSREQAAAMANLGTIFIDTVQALDEAEHRVEQLEILIGARKL